MLSPKKFSFSMVLVSLFFIALSIPSKLIGNITMVYSEWNGSLVGTMSAIRSIEYERISGKRIIFYRNKVICNMKGYKKFDSLAQFIKRSACEPTDLAGRLMSVGSKFKFDTNKTQFEMGVMRDKETNRIHTHPLYRDPITGNIIQHTSNVDFAGSENLIKDKPLPGLIKEDAVNPGTIIKYNQDIIDSWKMSVTVYTKNVDAIRIRYPEMFDVSYESRDIVKKILDNNVDALVGAGIDVSSEEFLREIACGTYDEFFRNPGLIIQSNRSSIRDDDIDQ